MLGRSSDVIWLVGILVLSTVGCTVLADRPWEEQIAWYSETGEVAYRAGELSKARRYWKTGLDLARQHGDPVAAVDFLISLARLAESTGDYRDALTNAREGLGLAETLSDLPLQGRALNVIGLVYRRLGEYGQARSHSRRAQAIAKRLDDPSMASESLRNLGAVRQAQGDFEAALKLYREALTLARKGEDKAEEAMTLNNIAGIQRARGAYEEALENYQRSLALRKVLGDRPGQGRVLGNICLIYEQLNQIERALNDCKHALTIARQVGDRARQANHLNNIGGLHRHRGEFSEALQYYRRSLALKQDLGDKAGEARSLNNIGELYLVQGDIAEALSYFSRSLRIKEAIEDRSGVSATHYNLGLLYRRRQQYDEALEHFQKALVIQLEVGERELLWRIYDDLSRVYAAVDNTPVAIFFGKMAVNTLQTLRGDIRKLDKALQRSYLVDKLSAYKHLASLLIDQGRLPEAQRVLDMLKEEEYVDFVVRSGSPDRTDTPTSFRSDEKPLAELLEAFAKDLVAMVKDYEELRTKKRSLYMQGKNFTEEEQKKFNELKEDITGAEESLRVLLSHLVNELTTTEQISEIDEETLEFLFNLQGTIGDVSELSGMNAVMVHYLVTPDRLYIILTTPLVQVARWEPVSAKELHHRIQNLRAALLTVGDAVREPAAALYDLLIAPIADDLKQAGADLLWVSMDGALRYIPLTALYDRKSGRWLAQDFAVAMLTEATQTSWKDRPDPDWKVAGLGLSKKVEGYPRLPAVVEELEGIVRRETEQDQDGVLPGIINLDDAFTAAALEELLDLQIFSVIHIASHFVLPQGGDYREAFLVLGNGEKLSLDRFQSYRLFNVELLTLSACNTAVGEHAGNLHAGTETAADEVEFDVASGREVDGLAALVQRRGASSVLATLWEVADVATATFMQRFYRLREEGKSKAEALRAAQLSFIVASRAADSAEEPTERGVVLYDEPRELPSYSHPYFWAPFILMGNWL